MNQNSIGSGFQAKEEGNDGNKFLIPKITPSSSRQWPGFRNPRIVRVSRSFGGKDRHSKVCTIRGLRDRRIRLSVPTAIQLYDLQDKLGLGQPSKVIDWLLDITKDDIDKLPPLQLPQGFGQFHQQMGFNIPRKSADNSLSVFPPLFNVDQDKQNWDIMDASSRNKEVEREGFDLDKGKWIKETDDVGAQSSSAHKFSPSLLNNPSMGYNPYYHLDPSNLSISGFGNPNSLPQQEVSLNGSNNSMNLPSGSQLFFCPTIPPLFPPYPSYPADSTDSRQINHFQLFNANTSSSQQFLPNSLMMRSFLNVNPGFGDTQRNEERSTGQE